MRQEAVECERQEAVECETHILRTISFEVLIVRKDLVDF